MKEREATLDTVRYTDQIIVITAFSIDKLLLKAVVVSILAMTLYLALNTRLCFQLVCSGEPSNVRVYSVASLGGVLIADATIVPLSAASMHYLTNELRSPQYATLTNDALGNLHYDPRYGPCDADTYTMRDWTSGQLHQVECFTDEPGIGRKLATWVLERGGLVHSYSPPV